MEIPDVEQISESLFQLAEWVRENFDENEVLDPDNAVSGVDARLQVTEDGWQVFRGERYDEEDGVWATIWLPYESDEEDCEELAEQLWGEAEDALEDF